MKQALATGLIAVSCAICAPAGATEVVSLEGARAKFDYDDVGSSNGVRLNFEHRFDGHLFGLGLGYYDSGKASLQNSPVRLSFSAFDIQGTVAIPPTPDSKSRFLIGAGLYHGSFKGEAFGISASTTGTGLTLDVGFDWMFTDNVGARIGYQNYLKVKDGADDKGIAVLRLGVVVAWGGAAVGASASQAASETQPATPAPPPAPQPAPQAQPAPTPPPAEPAPQPAASPTPAPAQPAPEATPPSAPAPQAETPAVQAPAAAAPPSAPAAQPATAAPAPAPAALTVGGHAKLRDAAFGRNRATLDGAAVAGLGAGTSVKLKSTMENSTGTWWYVVAPTASGWARAQDLEAQP